MAQAISALQDSLYNINTRVSKIIRCSPFLKYALYNAPAAYLSYECYLDRWKLFYFIAKPVYFLSVNILQKQIKKTEQNYHFNAQEKKLLDYIAKQLKEISELIKNEKVSYCSINKNLDISFFNNIKRFTTLYFSNLSSRFNIEILNYIDFAIKNKDFSSFKAEELPNNVFVIAVLSLQSLFLNNELIEGFLSVAIYNFIMKKSVIQNLLCYCACDSPFSLQALAFSQVSALTRDTKFFYPASMMTYLVTYELNLLIERFIAKCFVQEIENTNGR